MHWPLISRNRDIHHGHGPSNDPQTRQMNGAPECAGMEPKLQSSFFRRAPPMIMSLKIGPLRFPDNSIQFSQPLKKPWREQTQHFLQKNTNFTALSCQVIKHTLADTGIWMQNPGQTLKLPIFSIFLLDLYLGNLSKSPFLLSNPSTVYRVEHMCHESEAGQVPKTSFAHFATRWSSPSCSLIFSTKSRAKFARNARKHREAINLHQGFRKSKAGFLGTCKWCGKSAVRHKSDHKVFLE